MLYIYYKKWFHWNFTFLVFYFVEIKRNIFGCINTKTRKTKRNNSTSFIVLFWNTYRHKIYIFFLKHNELLFYYFLCFYYSFFLYKIFSCIRKLVEFIFIYKRLYIKYDNDFGRWNWGKRLNIFLRKIRKFLRQISSTGRATEKKSTKYWKK